MASLLRTLIAAVVLFACAGSVRAEGLVQLTLNGSVEARGGAPIELSWAFWESGEAREVDLRLHLAESTQAFDVASLIAMKLRARGAKVLFPGEHSGRLQDVQLFVEKTTMVSLRLGTGLWSRVTTCDSVPEWIKFSKPLGELDGAALIINTSTMNQHTKTPGTVLLEMSIDSHSNASGICEKLFQMGLSKGLQCDRPFPDKWTPVRGSDGSSLTGCSIEMRSPGTDWGLEVRLKTPVVIPR